MSLELEKRKSDLFSFPFQNCLLGFIFFLSLHLLPSLTCLAGMLLSLYLSMEAKGGQAALATQPLPSTPVCSRWMVVTLELRSAELFEELALKAASDPSLQRVRIRSQESAFLTSTSQVVLCWWSSDGSLINTMKGYKIYQRLPPIGSSGCQSA